MLAVCPIELKSHEKISWRCIRYTVIEKNNEGQDKKAHLVEYNETPAREFLARIP